MKRAFLFCAALLVALAIGASGQENGKDEGGRVLALEKAWNRALEGKDANALEMLLANTLVSVDIDGSVQTKSEFLASVNCSPFVEFL